MLPIIPEDSDSGRTYTCRVLNPAAPAGRQTSVTINVQREFPNTLSEIIGKHVVFFPVNPFSSKEKCFFISSIRFSCHRPSVGDSLSPASDCNRRGQGSFHLLCFSQPRNHRLQVSTLCFFTPSRPQCRIRAFGRIIGLNDQLDWQHLIVIGTCHESANSHFDTHGEGPPLN